MTRQPWRHAPSLSSPLAPSRILVDDPAIVSELRAVFPDTLMHHRPEIEWPVELDAVFDPAVAETIALAGGLVHIESTRAAILADVDSESRETASREATGPEVNLAAVDAIARQTRLRYLGGGIVIDFVGSGGSSTA